MAKAKKPLDPRVPRPFPEKTYAEMESFLNVMHIRTANLYDIDPNEIKNFIKINEDDRNYMSDVVEVHSVQPDTIVNTINVPSISDAILTSYQCRKIGQLFVDWGQMMLRNGQQADSYGYQCASNYEGYVDAGINANVKGAQMIKNKLESNREARKRKAAATRAANVKAAEEAAKVAETTPPKA